RGYDATLVSDAHTTEDLSPWGAPPPELVIAHTNLYWGNHEAPGRTAGTVEAKNVDVAMKSGPNRRGFSRDPPVSNPPPPAPAQRSDLNAARISVEKSPGSSQAAKWPPLSTSWK